MSLAAPTPRPNWAGSLSTTWTRVYAGSLDDARLNAEVQRYAAQPAALAELEQYYLTGGMPHAPLVTLHTTHDPIVPYWHHTMYRDKIISQRHTCVARAIHGAALRPL